MTVLIWKAVSTWIAYTHKTLVSPVTGFILGFVMCDDVKEYGCINDSQKCGLQYSRGLTGNFIPFLRLEAKSYSSVTGCPGRKEESCSDPNQKEDVETLFISDCMHYPCLSLQAKSLSHCSLDWKWHDSVLVLKACHKYNQSSQNRQDGYFPVKK